MENPKLMKRFETNRPAARAYSQMHEVDSGMGSLQARARSHDDAIRIVVTTLGKPEGRGGKLRPSSDACRRNQEVARSAGLPDSPASSCSVLMSGNASWPAIPWMPPYSIAV